MSVLTDKEDREVLKEIFDDERIEKEVSLSWDGRNLMLRLPKEIAEFLELNEKNRFKKNIKFIIEEKNGKIMKSFEVVNREKPKRKIKRKSKKNDK